MWNSYCTYPIYMDGMVVRHIDSFTLLLFCHFTFVFKCLQFIFSSELNAKSAVLHWLNWICEIMFELFRHHLKVEKLC